MTTDTIADWLLAVAITGYIAYLFAFGWLLASGRKRYRVTCQCGHRARTVTLPDARLTSMEHMLACRGRAIVSPLPAAEIAENAAE